MENLQITRKETLRGTETTYNLTEKSKTLNYNVDSKHRWQKQ